MKNSTRFLKTTKHLSLAAAIAAGGFGILVCSSALAGRSTVMFTPISQNIVHVITPINLRSQTIITLSALSHPSLHNQTPLITIQHLAQNLAQNTHNARLSSSLQALITSLSRHVGRNRQPSLVEAKSECSSDSIVHVMDREVAELQIMLATAMGGGGGGSGGNGENYCATRGEEIVVTEAEAEELVGALNDAAAALVAALDESSLSKMTSDQKAQVIDAAKAVAILLNAARNA